MSEEEPSADTKESSSAPISVGDSHATKFPEDAVALDSRSINNAETQPQQKSSFSSQDARNELTRLLESGKIDTSDIPAIKTIIQEHFNLKEKVDKLKSLLGRSAKAQRETKVDLEASQKRLSQALREIERLNQKLDKLQSRPTHSKLLILPF
jgi:chromosome segregation ATPase